ncbi:MAG: hypothetical protein JW808_04655 [Victivallales bacterium]|nr:hypothetical protein [Victivallales bacterium]
MIEATIAVHKKQVQTCLRLTGCKLGYLLNFGEDLMKTGITCCVNGLEELILCASAPLREKRKRSSNHWLQATRTSGAPELEVG